MYRVLLADSRVYGSSAVFERDVSSVDDFFAAMKLMDGHISQMQQNFDVHLHRANCPLLWETEPHKNGGRFFIVFVQNTIAFRTFCVLAHDWLRRLIGFEDNILGISINIKEKSFKIQVWVDDGRDPIKVGRFWGMLKDWLLDQKRGRLSSDNVHLEFHVHRNAKPSTVSSKPAPPAVSIGQLGTSNTSSPPAEEKPKPIVFNLDVARKYKRKWSEKRREQAGSV